MAADSNVTDRMPKHGKIKTYLFIKTENIRRKNAPPDFKYITLNFEENLLISIIVTNATIEPNNNSFKNQKPPNN